MRTLSGEFLLIDIGNSQTKLRLAAPDRLLGRTRRLPTGTIASGWQEVLRGWSYRCVVLASVVPAAMQVVAKLLEAPMLSVHHRLNTGIDLRRYPGIRTLGADRLADLTGAGALHGPGPLIVADLGTAAVFNGLDANGVFLGGIIAPGFAAMTARAAQLPRVQLRGPVRALGRTTRQALQAGALLGYRGLLREILAEMRSELPGARLVLTGGDAARAAELGLEIDVLDPELTLQGLRVIACLNPIL